MASIRIASLRDRLVALILVAAFPVIGLAAYSYLTERREAVQAGREAALRFARGLARAHEQRLGETQRLLVTLSASPEMDSAGVRVPLRGGSPGVPRPRDPGRGRGGRGDHLQRRAAGPADERHGPPVVRSGCTHPDLRHGRSRDRPREPARPAGRRPPRTLSGGRHALRHLRHAGPCVDRTPRRGRPASGLGGGALGRGRHDPGSAPRPVALGRSVPARSIGDLGRARGQGERHGRGRRIRRDRAAARVRPAPRAGWGPARVPQRRPASGGGPRGDRPKPQTQSLGDRADGGLGARGGLDRERLDRPSPRQSARRHHRPAGHGRSRGAVRGGRG